jgi:hypothetical protein
MGIVSSPAQPQAPAQGGQKPQAWISQPAQSQAQGFTTAHMNQSGTSLPQNQTQAPITQLHGPPNRLPSQNSVPPRSNPTPQQMLAAPLPSQMSPSMANNFPFAMANLRPSSMSQSQPPPQPQFMQAPPALEKVRFDNAYTSWCSKQNIHLDTNRPVIDNRPVDLHALHTQVMNAGGANAVSVFAVGHFLHTELTFRCMQTTSGRLLVGNWDTFISQGVILIPQNLDLVSRNM